MAGSRVVDRVERCGASSNGPSRRLGEQPGPAFPFHVPQSAVIGTLLASHMNANELFRTTRIRGTRFDVEHACYAAQHSASVARNCTEPEVKPFAVACRLSLAST